MQVCSLINYSTVLHERPPRPHSTTGRRVLHSAQGTHGQELLLTLGGSRGFDSKSQGWQGLAQLTISPFL